MVNQSKKNHFSFDKKIFDSKFELFEKLHPNTKNTFITYGYDDTIIQLIKVYDNNNSIICSLGIISQGGGATWGRTFFGI